MGKISDRQTSRVTKPQSDWKESRLVIAALSVAGTATFMSTVVLPITTSALTAKLENLTHAENKIDKLEKELSNARQRLSSAEATAALATTKTPFLPGSVYPVGADKVLLGATRQYLTEIYPKGEWNEDNDYYSVETGHLHFNHVTYFFTGSPKNQNVTIIMFHLNSESPLHNGAIKDRFSVLFGPPTATGKKGQAWWKTSSRESIAIDKEHSYSISTSVQKPAWALK